MFRGELLAIATRPERRAEVRSCQAVTAIAGRGLDGDHICAAGPGKLRQVTLIESEALEACASDYQRPLSHADSRRNLLTRGVPLNHLVGRQFRVGEAVMRGVELCEPCRYLEGILDRKVIDMLAHRGGLCAEVIRGGDVRVGDVIEPLDSSPPPATAGT